MRESPDPFELILALADSSGGDLARDVVRLARDEIFNGADVGPWARAVLLARDFGSLSADGAHYLLDIFIEEATAGAMEQDPELRDAARAMDACRAAHGLGDDEDFLVDDAPDDWQAARRRWERRFDLLRADWLRRLGENRMANDLLLRPADYEARSRRGWREVIDLDDDEGDADGSVHGVLGPP